jgi:nucleoside-diphosphate-sugar epimerase
MTSNVKTVAFLGASGGVGLAALKHTLAAGHQCIALCRYPSKLTAIFNPETTSNLKVVEGNAHDVTAVSKCLLTEEGKLADLIVSTIGGKPIISKMTIDDPEVCQKGATALLEALAQVRRDGATGHPQIIACSSKGISKFGRNSPMILDPLYFFILKVPHVDKRAMEDIFMGSGEDYTIVRPALLTQGETKKKIRVGVEDIKTGRESDAPGYTISKEDTGKWVADNLILCEGPRYLNKFVSLSY